MRSVETEGGSIDEAIEEALDALRMDREQVEIEILENASRGLFGLGSRRARIRATVRASLASRLDPQACGSTTQVSRETPPRSVEGPTAGPVSRGEKPSAGPVPRDEAAGRACRVLQTILDNLVDSPRVEEIRDGHDPATIRLALSAADSGMVIGRRGQTLDALEHLVNRIVFRDEAEPGARVVLDVEGYRQRRQAALEQLAHRLAAKAKATGRVVTLNPMSPRDRRIVHLTLQSDPAVTTSSQGDGHYRKVMIVPKGGRRGSESVPSR